ncbi:MAG TPA: ATP-binding protein [Gelidibacter sp.]|uniref:tetratricopeptide repeat-containing sensor histidine kinase n=1 Tax=Gelidibacter sp. TaxID=2018083 RepID=UPI002C9C1787|nr:ATP-binding protein [Gelidibacter sp.]HXJ99682.1 ATP-binding protein [Gelidibacter sp.]
MEDNNYFLRYDDSEFNDAQKEQLLDNLYIHFSAQDNNPTNRHALFKVASRYEKLDLETKYYNTVNKAQELALEKNDTLDIAKSLWYKGDFHDAKESYDSAFYYYSQSEKLYRSSKKDSLNWGRMLLYKAGTLYRMGIYTESEAETVKALNVFSKVNHSELLYESVVQMALNLDELKEYDDALKYYNLALQQLNKLKKENYPKYRLDNSYATYYNNIGDLFDRMGNHDKAKEHYIKGLAFDVLKENPKLHAMLLNNYAHNKMLSGNTHQVDSLLFLSLRIRDSINHEQGVIASKIRISEYYLSKKDTVQAIQNITEAYKLSVKNKSHLDILRSLEFLSENDKVNKDYYTERYITVKDSIREIERTTKNKFARISYETEKISLHNKELSKHNTLLALLFMVAILIIIITVIAYKYKLINQQLKHKQKEQLSTEKIQEILLKEKLSEEEARSEERNRISRELHDGIVNRIFTIRLNLSLLDSTNQELKDQLMAELNNAEKHIREVSHDLHSNFFSENQDFNRLLEGLISEQKNECHTKFNIAIDKFIEWSKVTDKQKVHIYRIIQEALNNINKYAKASKCSVVLLKKEQNIFIRIHDNGKGFNLQKIKNGLGFRIFEERTTELNGVLKIKSEIGKGTTIEVVFKKQTS